jgi:Replication-relaxation
MKLTSRDKEVIRQVTRFHFLRSTQIIRLVEGASAQLLRRLQALYHHGYLDRPRCQIDFFQQGGSRPMVYGLGSRGAALMRREFDVPFSKMVWSRSDGSVGRIFLEHTLMVAEILISVAERCKSTDNVKFIAGEELQSSKQKQGQFRWQATINGKRLGLIPDAAFALDFMDKPTSYLLTRSGSGNHAGYASQPPSILHFTQACSLCASLEIGCI